MPRKPQQRKTTAIIHAKGRPVRVTLYPPKPPRRSWYAFWPGLVAARSTGEQDREEALAAVVCMLENNGKLGHAKDLVLTDEEFREIQRWHFGRKTDESAKRRRASHWPTAWTPLLPSLRSPACIPLHVPRPMTAQTSSDSA